MFGCPVDGVGVPGILGERNRDVCSAVVGGGVAFAEVVCFYFGCVSTEPFLFLFFISIFPLKLHNLVPHLI